MPKFIFVTGGVVSALGKGIATASIALLMKRRGFSVSPLKFDPYLNVDPGTMNPFQHGEVFVTDDGAETDLDLGHYERFLDENLTSDNNVTAGQIYYSLIEKERRGDFLGGTVQVVPHLTDEIKSRVRKLALQEAQLVITEIGGTVGDIESLPFLEAIRQIWLEEKGQVAFVHMTLVPYIKTAGELKTKPTQHSVQKLREIGIQPDMILCRSDRKLSKETRDKIALFSNLPEESVIEALDVDVIYEIPLIFRREGVDDLILAKLGVVAPPPDLSDWEELVKVLKSLDEEVEIALCGKYVHLRDSYKSILEAFNHASFSNRVKVKLRFVDSEDVERKGAEALLKGIHGLLVPGGFGQRGIEGKIAAIRYAREKGIPFLGICLGMQVATIEFARNVLNMERANSTEFDPETPYPVITILPEKRGVLYYGGTLRKGAYPARIREGTLAHRIYGTGEISERHRHRYEFNPEYLEVFEEKGMVASGLSPDGYLAEIMELRDHPFFIGVQFHPEFKSRPMRVHPLFHAFVAAAREFKNSG
ncbi:MAG: CTP synthase [Candidatus Hydrothermae bacterium]|nr:CTP synthase [Candidatus Hydrothermae bacterium]